MLLLTLLSFLHALESLHKINNIKESNEDIIKELRNEHSIFKFYESKTKVQPKKIQHHVPFLLQKLKNMGEKAITYEMKKIKYTILPFNEVFMHDGTEKISLGQYKKSQLKDGLYWQVFECGDVCDLRRNIRRSTMVCFKSLAGELRIDSVVERKLCQYELTIGGDYLTRCIDDIVSVDFTKDNIEAKNEPKEDL